MLCAISPDITCPDLECLEDKVGANSNCIVYNMVARKANGCVSKCAPVRYFDIAVIVADQYDSTYITMFSSRSDKINRLSK